MKNTNFYKVLFSVWRAWMWICTVSLTIFLLMPGAWMYIGAAAMSFAIWVGLGFDPHHMEIDSCLDAGGRWIEEQNICEGARNHLNE